MKKEELFSIYSNEAVKLGFRPTAEQPYLVEPQLDNFIRLVQDGFLNEQPSKLIIEETGEDEEKVLDAAVKADLIANYYNERVKSSLFAGDCIVRIPGLVGSIWVDTHDHRYLSRVVERPVGTRIISMEVFPSCDPSLPFIRELIERSAKICYDTEWLLADARLSSELSRLVSPIDSAAGYFIKRFQKWRQIRKEQGGGVCNPWSLLGKYAREKSMVKFLEALDLDDIEMSYGFNVFGNTDLIETEDGKIWIPDAKIEPKPRGYLASAWLWNLVLYGWKSHPEQLFESFTRCLQIFCRAYQADGEFAPPIKYSVFERLYAALEIDLRYRRSPYNQLSDAELNSGIENVSYIFNRMIE